MSTIFNKTMHRTNFLTPLAIFLLSIGFSQEKDRFSAEVADIIQKHGNPSSIERSILFTGSSSVRMWDTLQEDFSQHKVINNGFGGSEFSDLLFFRKELIAQFSPEKVFIYEGDNDIAGGKSPRKTFRHAKKLYRKLKRELPDSKLYFITPKPSIARWNLKEQYEAYNKMLGKFAARRSIAFVDVWGPMLDADGSVRKDIFIYDNLHMNAKGYDIWEQVIRPFVED